MAIKFSPKEPSKDAPKDAGKSPAKDLKPAKQAQPRVDEQDEAAGAEGADEGPGDLFKAAPKPAGRKQKFRS